MVDAIDLEVVVEVFTSNGRRIVVDDITIRAGDLTAYNLTVEDLRTYFVGRESVLVHSYEEKLFATTADDAARYGRINYGQDAVPFYIVETRLPRSFADQLYTGTADRMTCRADTTGAVLSTESYSYDAASNVISQTIDGATTSYVYDRNRLLTATTDGVTASYNYDPFGRLNTVTAAGEVIESYTYDGFDASPNTPAWTRPAQPRRPATPTTRWIAPTAGPIPPVRPPTTPIWACPSRC